MPSFDVVSEVDAHELANAVDQTTREIGNRFDLKGSGARVEQDKYLLTLIAEADFQVQQVLEILRLRIAKRGIDVTCLDIGEVSRNLSEARQKVTVRNGLDAEYARKVVKAIKETQIKVQVQIQDEQVRITGKKRDDLQDVMAALRGMTLGVPLQFTNFRD
jgi:cyclic-di-GMP-binding protein